MSDKLMSSSDNELAQQAMRSHILDISLRGKRKFMSELPKSQLRSLVLAPKKAKKAEFDMEIYDIKHSTNPAHATLLWQNGKTIQKLDKDARNIVKGGRGTWDFYFNVFGRNSVDNLGLLLKHYIHYGKNDDDINNAMWDGEQMVYGDGDGQVYGSFTTDIDIIGHELTHAVTQYESNLEYHDQSGALDESLADVFGIMVKQRMKKEDVKKSNWLIGENVLLGNNYALRNMKAPGTAYVNHPYLDTDPQPATMDKYLHKPNTEKGDYGGVHYNSGIPNFAFYVTAFDIGGYAWEKAGRIWYEAMTDDRLQSTATFSDFKNLTIKKATSLFGAGSKELKAIKAGWAAAKV